MAQSYKETQHYTLFWWSRNNKVENLSVHEIQNNLKLINQWY